MDCEKIRQTLSAEMDGEAADHELPAAYRHLADCAGCRHWRRALLQIGKEFPAWTDQAVPPEVTDRLRERLRTADSASHGRRAAYRIPRPLAWAAAAILVLQIGWSSYRLVSPAGTPGEEVDAFIPHTIVLTDRDRVSTTTIVHNPPANTDER